MADLTQTKFDTTIPVSSLPPESKPYAPQGKAVDVLYSKDAEVIIDGPANTGKSRAILEKLNLICLKYPKARVLVIRKTRASLTQSAVVTFETFVAQIPQSLFWRASDQEYRYNNGSKLVLGGLDKSTRVLSTEYDIIYIQEATELNEEEYETLVTRARNGIVPYNQVICDCNPGPPWHWLKRRWEAGKAKRIKTTHQDNPRLYNADGEITEFGATYLAKLQALSGVRYKRLYLGDWAAADGLIYEIDHEVHFIYHFSPPKEWRRFLSIDFGYTNPFVCQWWALDEDLRMYRYRELYMTRRTVSEHAKQIVQLSEGEEFETAVCDHDAGDRATLEEYNIHTTPAQKDVRVGIQAVEDRLKVQDDGRARIFFMHDSLVEIDREREDEGKSISTEQEFDNYVWSNSKLKEAPIKAGDHGMDAMRYAVLYADNYSATGGIYA